MQQGEKRKRDRGWGGDATWEGRDGGERAKRNEMRGKMKKENM